MEVPSPNLTSVINSPCGCMQVTLSDSLPILQYGTGIISFPYRTAIKMASRYWVGSHRCVSLAASTGTKSLTAGRRGLLCQEKALCAKGIKRGINEMQKLSRGKGSVARVARCLIEVVIPHCQALFPSF